MHPRMQGGAARYGWAYFRRNGVRAAVRAIIGRYIHRSVEYLVLCSRTIDQDAPDRVGDVVFRLATPSDRESLQRFDRARRVTQHPSLAPHREWCFLACDGDRIVATRRYTDTLPPQGLMSRVLRLTRGQLWAADVFCLPQYRNRGIARGLGLFAQRVLAAEGFTEFFGGITVANTASLRMTLHDSEFVCHVRYVRCVFRERLRLSRELPASFRASPDSGPREA
jgi:hypothetical protein